MVRKVEVIVPTKHAGKVREILLLKRSVHHLSYIQAKNERGEECTIFHFKIVNKKTHELIDLLTLYGVGNRFGSLDVYPLSSTKPRITTEKQVLSNNILNPNNTIISKMIKKRKYAIHERLAYDEIYETIDSQLHLTFDYLALIVVGALIAGVGLLTNSSVSVVASMLVSPLMGPILGMTFGAIIKDKEMFLKGFRNELIGVIVCFITGGLLGFITAPILDDAENNQMVYGENTQMSSRGDINGLGWGIAIAVPSGVGVALGVASDQVAALIGVAISAALLPPIVNAGLSLCSSLVFFINPHYNQHVVNKWIKCGAVSLLLFLLNWICIFVFGILTFRLKKLHESANNEERMRRLSAFQEKIEQIGFLDQSNLELYDTPNTNGNTNNNGNNNKKAVHKKSTGHSKNYTYNPMTTPLLSDSHNSAVMDYQNNKSMKHKSVPNASNSSMDKNSKSDNDLVKNNININNNNNNNNNNNDMLIDMDVLNHSKDIDMDNDNDMQPDAMPVLMAIKSEELNKSMSNRNKQTSPQQPQSSEPQRHQSDAVQIDMQTMEKKLQKKQSIKDVRLNMNKNKNNDSKKK